MRNVLDATQDATDATDWWEDIPPDGYYRFLDAVFDTVPKMPATDRLCWMWLFMPQTAQCLNLPEPEVYALDVYRQKYNGRTPDPQFQRLKNGRMRRKFPPVSPVPVTSSRRNLQNGAVASDAR